MTETVGYFSFHRQFGVKWKDIAGLFNQSYSDFVDVENSLKICYICIAAAPSGNGVNHLIIHIIITARTPQLSTQQNRFSSRFGLHFIRFQPLLD